MRSEEKIAKHEFVQFNYRIIDHAGDLPGQVRILGELMFH